MTMSSALRAVLAAACLSSLAGLLPAADPVITEFLAAAGDQPLLRG